MDPPRGLDSSFRRSAIFRAPDLLLPALQGWIPEFAEHSVFSRVYPSSPVTSIFGSWVVNNIGITYIGAKEQLPIMLVTGLLGIPSSKLVPIEVTTDACLKRWAY